MRKKNQQLDGRKVHAYVPELCEQLRRGEVSRREFLRTATLLGVSAGAAYGLAGAITGEMIRPAHAQATPKRGGRLRFSVSVQEITDPATAAWIEASNLFRNSIEYLVEVGADNIARPYLAESWHPSDDLKTWEFRLRKGITWSNGDPFTTRDVAFNFQRWLAPDSKSTNKTLFSAVQDVEVIDDHTFRLHLSQPVLSIPENLYQHTCAIVHHRFEDEGGNWGKNPVGTGPFELVEHRVGERCIVRRKNGYWGGDAYLDEIHYIDLGEDLQAHVAALASGQVDQIYRVSVAQLDLITKIPGVRLYESKVAHCGVIRMQVDQKPFDDIRVRQALQLCADNKMILDFAYRGRGAVGEHHHVAPFQPEYFKLPPVKQDIARARQLLAEAGHADGLDLELTVGNTQGTWEQDCCALLKEQAAQAGFRIRLNVLPSAQYWTIWDKASFSLTYWAHRPLAVMTHALAYRSGAPWNESHFSNAEYDAALDRAMGIPDPVERSKAMEPVERILQENAVIIQPFWGYNFTAGSTRVQDFIPHPSHYYRMDRVWLA